MTATLTGQDSLNVVERFCLLVLTRFSFILEYLHVSVELVKARRGCWIPQSWSYRGRTELGSSARVALTLNSWPLFPTPWCVFICISLMTGDGEHFFLCLLVVCTPSPEGCLLISLSHSFTGLSDCLLLSLSLKRMLPPPLHTPSSMSKNHGDWVFVE